MDSRSINSRRKGKQATKSEEAGISKEADIDTQTAPADSPRRIDRLAEIVDLCTEARRIAQDLDEGLLSYLLAMAVQETRAGMRQQVTATAGTVKLATRRPRARRMPI